MTIDKSNIASRLKEDNILVKPKAAEVIVQEEKAEKILEKIPSYLNDNSVLSKEKAEQYVEDIKKKNVDKNTNTNTNTSNDKKEENIKKEESIIDISGDNILEEDLTYDSTNNEEKKNWKEKWNEEINRVILNENINTVERRLKEANVKIEFDITGSSSGEGEFDDFYSMFRDRYKKLKNLIKKDMSVFVNISGLQDYMKKTRGRDREVGVVGIVTKTGVSKKDNKYVVIEGISGQEILAVYSDGEHDDTINKIVKDEIVGITGQLSDNGEIIFGEDIIFPDVPHTWSPTKSDENVKAVLISDTHFGSELFANEKWKEFVKWISTQENIKYLLIAGDLVEGIGVYPDQKEELSITDIYDQYKLCAEAFKQLPEDLEIITSVGNHDIIRLAEPQPALQEEIQDYFGDNVTFVGNPSKVNIHGVKFLLYHGVSLNALADEIPGKDIREPQELMKLMLQKRHLGPIYGENIRYSPEEKDHLIIDEVPDYLHSGHVHKYGTGQYKGSKVINTGCWVDQTKFQEKLNIDPDVGYATIVNLKDNTLKTKEF